MGRCLVKLGGNGLTPRVLNIYMKRIEGKVALITGGRMWVDYMRAVESLERKLGIR